MNERNDKNAILIEIFNPQRQHARQGALFADYVRMLMSKYPQRLIPALTAADFDLETVEELILSSKLPGAKALIAEKKGDLDQAAQILLLQFEAALTADLDVQVDMLNQFLLYANRQSPQLTQEKRNELFLPLFKLFKELTTQNMKTILPMALTGLIGKIPMEPASAAWLMAPRWL